jgi:hypothetical protein
LWLWDGAQTPNSESLRRCWLECTKRTPAVSAYLHPDLVSGTPGANGAVPILYTRWGHEGGEPDRLDCLAALVQKNIRVRLFPGLPWDVSLRGYRLVGNELLGDNSDVAVNLLVRELMLWLVGQRRENDCVLFEDLEVGSSLWNVLHQSAMGDRVAVFYPSPPQPHLWIEFPRNAADYWKRFSKKPRQTLRRKAKLLPHEIRCYTRREEVAEFLHKAHQVSKRSWQAKRLGIRITNDPAHRKRLEVLASLGALRSYLLEHEGDPLAFVLGIQWKGCFLFEETGYHSGYKKWSPGTVLLFRLLEDLTVRDTPRLVDFGFGDAQYKRSFANRETLSGPVLLVRRSLRPMAVMWLNRVRQMVSHRMRAVIKSLSLTSVLRQRYRR